MIVDRRSKVNGFIQIINVLDNKYVDDYNTSKKINRSMGNIPEHSVTIQSTVLPVKSIKRPLDTRLIGPNHLNFKKMTPKMLETDEDILTSSQDANLPQYLQEGDRDQDSISSDNQFTDNETKCKQVEAIKIKWNSFIKMKKKSYLEDYVVIKQIGKGGFGTVSKVQAKYTGVFRAAKKIRKSTLANNDHEKLFAQMAIMITLDHPGISRLYQVYDYKSSYVLILELCEGGQLFKKIIAQSINEAMAAGIMIKLFQALMYLHAKGIIHRDLKPQNILFENTSKSSELKLIDFGIAIRKDNQTKLSARIGTPYYIAPEVLCKCYDQKCDIWSAGVILYMMLCYRPPFNGDTQTQVMESILRTEPSFNGVYFKNVSEQCVDFLKKILTKNPDLRPSAIEAYSHPWIKKYLKCSNENHQSTISNISNFKFDNRLEAVVYTFIVSQILTSKQKETMKELFQKLDKNHDGVISSQELRQALLNIKDLTEDRIDFLMRIIDTNNSGVIDFTQFIVAALEPQNLSKSHFEQAFAYFDIDHSGVITYDEISTFLEDKQHSENQIRTIFREMDQNHDGQISKQQFLKVLCKKEKERLQRERHKTKKNLKRLQSIKQKKQ